MTELTLDDSRDGLGDFPPGMQPVARDDLGDVLAVDAGGIVWCFAHGAGAWSAPSRAFESMAALHAFVAGQADLGPVDTDDALAALQARKQRVDDLKRRLQGSPYARDAAKQVLAELRLAIAEARFRQSKRGRNLHARQQVGVRCEQALRDAGAPGDWMVRAQGDADQIAVMGPFAPPWDERRVRELLAQILEGRYGLNCVAMPETRPR